MGGKCAPGEGERARWHRGRCLIYFSEIALWHFAPASATSPTRDSVAMPSSRSRNAHSYDAGMHAERGVCGPLAVAVIQYEYRNVGMLGIPEDLVDMRALVVGTWRFGKRTKGPWEGDSVAGQGLLVDLEGTEVHSSPGEEEERMREKLRMMMRQQWVQQIH